MGGKLLMERKEKEVKTVETALIIALVVAVPVILFPAAFIWYFNIGGVLQAVRAAKKARAQGETAQAK
jgi:hypothetical protein